MSVGRRLHLPAALAFAAAIHAGLMIALTWPEQRGLAASFGTGGVTVSLGPAGRSPGGIPSDPVEFVPEVAPPEPLEPVARPADVAQSEVDLVEPVQEVAMTAAEASDPATELLPAAEEPSPDIAQPTDTSAPVLTAATAPPELAIEPEPAVERFQPVDGSEPVEVARAVSAPPLPARRPEAPAEHSAAAPPRPPGQGGVAGSTAEADRGSGDSSSGGGEVGTSADYDALLLAWLERHKTYPRRAQIQQRQGIVMVRFVIDRDGGLISSAIARSSGHEILDREGLETIRRAAPMPQPPPELAGAPLERVVPIAFSMR